jgi:hypothetical protein
MARIIKNLWIKKHGKLIVAYDFDHTVFDPDNIGYVYNDVIDLLRIAKKKGCHLIVSTTRSDSEHGFIKKYLNDNSIPFDVINEGLSFYDILLDDRAGLPSAYYCLKIALEEIE